MRLSDRTIRPLLATLGIIASIGVARPLSAGTLSLSIGPLLVEFTGGAGETSNQRVTIKNSGSERERVVLQPIDWRNGVDGSFKMERLGTEGTSSLTQFLKISATDVTLEPGESRDLSLTLNLPSTFSSAPGVYWGGYNVRAVSAGGSTGSFGAAANILVLDTVGKPKTHVKLVQLHASPAGQDGALLTARFVNDSAGYVRPTVRVLVVQGARIVHDESEGTGTVFPGATRLYTKDLTGLLPGDYDIELTIDYGGATLIEGTTKLGIR
ncbi:MAG: hypothetical protein WCE44_07905 [Candidatus Velthaea sp.]|jgi:hypothetical protein